ncbi:hypothetical protein KCU68_g1573, partial [Aureobasidium melanogenum]
MISHFFTGLSLVALGVSKSSTVIPDSSTQIFPSDAVILSTKPLVPGGDGWTKLSSSCVESSGRTGIDCLSDALSDLLEIAVSRDGRENGATDSKNGTLAEKRSPIGAKGSGLTLRSTSEGSQTMQGSTTSTYSSRSTMFEHISNGTHGTVRAVASLDGRNEASGEDRRYRRNTFSYGEKVQGLKLSYSTHCGFVPFSDQSLKTLRNLVGTSVYSASTNMHSDKYALEILNIGNNVNNHMLATVVAEADVYGNDYEEYQSAPLYPSGDQC